MSHLYIDFNTKSNLPKRNNENGVTGRVVSKNNNNNENNTPNNSTSNNETKTNITIVNEKPIEDVNKNKKELKQNAYNNNDNIAGLPKTNEEKREAVKTGDNLFSKITLFTAILSIFGLSYLPFLKKKKIEINSEN